MIGGRGILLMLSVLRWLVGFSLISLLFAVNTKIGPQGMQGRFTMLDIIIAIVYLGAWCYFVFRAGRNKNREVGIAAIIYACYPIIGYGLNQWGGPITQISGGLFIMLWLFPVQELLELVSIQTLALLQLLLFIVAYYWGNRAANV